MSHANSPKPGIEGGRRAELEDILAVQDERAFGVDLAVGEDEERVERQRRVVFEEGPTSGL